MYKTKDEDGFTLIEIILAISIVGIIISTVFSANITGFRVLNFNRSTIDAQQAARIIFSRMNPYIRSAVEIDRTNFPYELKMKFPEKVDSSGNNYHGMIYGIKDNGEFFYKKVYTDGSTSYRMSLTSEEIVKINDIIFAYNKIKKLLKITLVINAGNLKEKYFVEKIFLRNTDVITTP